MEETKKFKIIVPEKSVPRPKYYDVYVKYFINILKDNNLQLEFKGTDNDAKFLALINQKKIGIDYSDHPIIDNVLLSQCDVYFKFHCRKTHTENKKIVPFTPISFYDWERWRQLQNEITYTCNNNVVLNIQRPYGNAVERRKLVRGMLYEKYKLKNELIYSPHYTQEEYWKLINNCLVHVFVPGCYNDMLDRGHAQYMSFGCCTISPRIVDLLPWGKKIIPDYHYLMCKPDYSDLIEKIEWCKQNKQKCVQIGYNAKRLFLSCCTPQKLWQWILHNIDTH
jgi:hypothetical protein